MSSASKRQHEILREPNASRPEDSDKIALIVSYFFDFCAANLIKFSVLYLGLSNQEECATARIRIISSTNFNAQFSLFTNNMFVTLLSSKHVEDNSVTNILLVNKENCALKLVDEIILYYDARSKNTKKQHVL